MSTGHVVPFRAFWQPCRGKRRGAPRRRRAGGQWRPGEALAQRAARRRAPRDRERLSGRADRRADRRRVHQPRHQVSEASFRKYVQQGLLAAEQAGRPQGQAQGLARRVPGQDGAPDQRRQAAHARRLHDRGDPGAVPALHGSDRRRRASTSPSCGRGSTSDRAQLEAQARRELTRRWPSARKTGDELVERLGELTRRIAAPRTDTLRLAGAAGGAEDLL